MINFSQNRLIREYKEDYSDNGPFTYPYIAASSMNTKKIQFTLITIIT